MRAMPARSRVIVGLSGGVDSAVAALLLKDLGHDVHGLFMSNWDEEDDAYCTTASDYQDARAIAREVRIPLHRVSFAAEYRERVFKQFLAEQLAGRTPNPDVLCNREIKFGVALRYARRLGADCYATGHYARLVHGSTGPELRKAFDQSKDQTYFLHAVERADLVHALMPLGEKRKAEVRELARRAGLPVFDKPDSTGICFVGERPFREFLAQFLRDEPGPIQTPEGVRLGTHRGLPFYTLGQRGGLGLGGQPGALEEPWYVAAKDIARNALIVVQGHDHPLLSSSGLTTGAVQWLVRPAENAFRCTVKVRHRQIDQPAWIELQQGGGARVVFDEPQRAVTPGQYAVVYNADVCLGGAVIEATVPVEARSAA
jgi:tRNA-uridine 2-sulfurtransferase